MDYRASVFVMLIRNLQVIMVTRRLSLCAIKAFLYEEVIGIFEPLTSQDFLKTDDSLERVTLHVLKIHFHIYIFLITKLCNVKSWSDIL